MMSPSRVRVSAVAAVSWPAAAEPRGQARTPRPLAAMAGALRRWREHARLRRELSQMSARDFGDLAVPPSLLADERRRGPWQRPSPQWRTVAERSGGGTAQ
jgi:uncharacterized protein YjiS (DUF1127 family)